MSWNSGPPSSSNFQCQICQRMCCRSHIGLVAHSKLNSWWWVLSHRQLSPLDWYCLTCLGVVSGDVVQSAVGLVDSWTRRRPNELLDSAAVWDDVITNRSVTPLLSWTNEPSKLWLDDQWQMIQLPVTQYWPMISNPRSNYPCLMMIVLFPSQLSPLPWDNSDFHLCCPQPGTANQYHTQCQFMLYIANNGIYGWSKNNMSGFVKKIWN